MSYSIEFLNGIIKHLDDNKLSWFLDSRGLLWTRGMALDKLNGITQDNYKENK